MADGHCGLVADGLAFFPATTEDAGMTPCASVNGGAMYVTFRRALAQAGPVPERKEELR